MAAPATMQYRTMQVPGGHVYHEVRGTGPVLLMMPGGPADATTFRKIEDTLASRHTVVTYDPRGISHSSPFDPRDDARMVEIFADDAHRLLDEVGGDGRCSIFASSGGAVIALELAVRHADRLDTVVVHEPPSPALLPDTAEVRAGMEQVCDTYDTEGLWPAMGRFMALVRIHDAPPPPDGEPTPEAREAMALMARNMEFFFGRYIRNIARYAPDLAALKACPCRIVPAAGADSAGQLAHEGALGLSRTLGVEAAVFPGDHGGFDGRPAEFAARLLEVLEGGRS
jgi:pimeloyl-ACP methyl ester carboxylesterase